jgi:type I restriction enzyme S subunit
MNVERLLAHYEDVADAPDAIPRLRRFVLDLAVRGKVVPQDPSDEPASELLNRIAKEKARRVEVGEIRKPPAVKPITLAEVLFALPTTWAWVRVADIFEYDAGIKREPRDLVRDRWLLELEDIEKDTSIILERWRVRDRDSRSTKSEFEVGDILYGKLRPYLNKVVVADEPGYSTTEIVAIRPLVKLCPEYCALALRRPDFVAYVERLGRGTKMPRLRTPDAIVALFPLPPLAEQHRIVAKVDELMALCDRLEAARVERDATRDRLTAASLARLNAPDPYTFRDDVRFALDALPALTARADQSKQLRQTILNLAVRGKLVPQDANDESAPEFDREIPVHLEPPFEIPRNWNWARLRSLGTLKGGGTPSKARDDYWNGPIPWVSPKDMKVDYLTQAQLSITEEAIAGSAANLIEAGSVLFVVRGMILAHSFPVAVTPVPLAINQDMKALVLKKPEMAEFILRALKGLKPEMLKRVQRSSHGTCRIEGDDYSEFLIPVPPLTEQHRIVAKVDELMALCDRLEAGLTSAADTRSRLLDALLAEALTPDEKRELEAAE